MSEIGSGVDLVAVVGTSCRLPGAEHPAALWRMLREGRDAIRELSPERAEAIGETPGIAGGWLDEVAGFDAEFFGIAPAEAVSMDPQQRLSLELAQHAFESAGLDHATLRGSRTGVFVGTIWNDYAELLDGLDPDNYAMTGIARSVIANRISYVFGLHGPSMSVDSGQSSSLVAVHLAAESLRSGESEIAVAGGVNLVLAPESTARSVAFGGLSPNGRCHTFDERADGYVRGEGGAFVVLKLLEDARRDGDPVLAVLAGSAVGNDGSTETLTTPSADAQAEVIRAACARSGIEPAELDYVELHGTGTPVGDPLEAAALGRTAGERGERAPLTVGSVKTNIGHLEGAAGVVGLLKTVLALANAEIPASLNFHRPPASIPLDELGLRVQTETSSWPEGKPRYAGVSSVGMGGTNCHVVLTGAPERDLPRPPVTESGARVPWVLSARSRSALAELAGNLCPLADSAADPGAVAGALARRTAFEHRAVVLTDPNRPTAELLTALATNAGDPAVLTGTGRAGQVTEPVLVFPGHGTQWAGMGRALLSAPDRAARVFRARLRECAAALVAEGGPDVYAVLAAAEPDRLEEIAIVQAASWAVTVALAAVWEDAGVRPAAVLGHSQGEITAAVVSGALSLAEGARVILARTEALPPIVGKGGMLSVALAPAELTERLAGTGLVLAATNGPASSVVSGSLEDLAEFEKTLRAEDVRLGRVPIEYASHSPAVDTVRAQLVSRIGALAPRNPRIPWLSTVTGEWMTGTAAPDAEYWARNLRAPVRFAQAVEALVHSGHTAFVECGPHPVLLGAIESTAAAAGDQDGQTVALGTLRRDAGDVDRLLSALAEAWIAGIELDWAAVADTPGPASLPPGELPRYPFQHRMFWPGRREIGASPQRLVPGPAAAEPVDGPFAGLSPEAARAELLNLVLHTTAELLGTDREELDPETTFRELGVDSVTAVELRTAIGRAVGLRLTSIVLFDHPSPARLVGWLVSQSAGAGSGGPASPAVVSAPVAEDPVVVVSVGCRFPGGVDSAEGLWDVVHGGADVLSGFPTDRGWPAGLVGGPTGSVAGRGGFLTGAGEFDAGFFGISPREALAMDPQQRILLECAWEAIERGGVDLRGSGTTGVFLGVMAQDYGPAMDRPAAGLDGYLLTGSSPSVASGRIAYVLGLEGPALTVDTACSSSLVALHLAVRSVRAGECDRALVGGATVLATPGIFLEFSRQGGLAPDGRCKPFAAAADGTGWGEGAGVVLLERLSVARAEGHRILGVIRGSAVNSDGASNGLSAPNGVAQQRVIRAALADAGLRAADVDAVEAHGTGTTLGDPIEAQALIEAYGEGRAAPLSLGSIKSVLGHTQAAAGIAGLIATVLAFDAEQLPTTRNIDAPSPHVDWDSGVLDLRGEPRPWPRGERPRRAGVSSFGISGTNAHVILEEPPSETAPVPERGARTSAVWVCSAAEADRLEILTQRLAELPESTEVDAVATALARRPALTHRAVLDPATRKPIASGTVRDRGSGVVFVFPGQGAQWAGMGAELLECSPVFRDRITECAQALAAVSDVDVLAVLRSGAELEDVGVVQPVSWAVMVGLAALWESAGVEPAAVLGHSQGEIAAAVVAGALTVEQGARVVASRAAALRALSGSGAMASVAEPESVVYQRLADCGVADRVSVAVVNGPTAVVVSGPVAEVETVVASAVADGVRARVLPVDYASHSPMVDGLVFDAQDTVPPRVRWLSTVDVEWVSGALPGDYWSRNLRGSVR
ncbi:type I polyketide synthase, partial [Sciscionella sediminilitoris]|uniref:type I polyketide synthase n=1 Tax=Sciscionella sediminilitoris TaxID=1445613 RepID=UPI0004DEE222